MFKHINDPVHHPTSSHLWVFCCVVTYSEIDVYCNAIKSQASSLQWIHLLPGSYLGDDGAYKLFECFSFDSQVIKIEIDGCGIGSQGLRHIGRMLNINSKILCLDVRKNIFTLDDVKEFLHLIKNQQYLQCLLIDKNFCKDSEIRATVQDINLIRTKNADPLILSHR